MSLNIIQGMLGFDEYLQFKINLISFKFILCTTFLPTILLSCMLFVLIFHLFVFLLLLFFSQ